MFKLRLDPDLLIPGVPAHATQIIGMAMVFSMIIGLNLRNAYPVFSVFAWGLPCVFMIPFCLQVSACTIGQALKVRELEKHFGVAIKPDRGSMLA